MGDQNDPTTVGDDLVESVVVNDAANLVTVKTLASGDATPTVGDTVTFQIVVTNNGAAQATNVSLNDSLPTGISFTGSTVSQGNYNDATGLFTIGTLNVGQTATLTLTGTVDAGQGGNTITNVTTAATGDQMDPTTFGDDLEEAVIVDNTTNLVTVKTLASGNATPDEGDTVTFDITVTNAGPITATNVSLNDSLPAGITFTGSTTTAGTTYNQATGLFDIGTLNVGQTATLTLTGTVDVGQGGNTITNITTAATGDQPDPSTVGDDLEEAVDVNNEANLVTVKTLASGDNTPAEGDTVTFQIAVTNNGGAQATNVSLTDSLPAGITYTADTTSQGSYDPATGLFTIGTLDVGDTAILTLSGTVDVGQGGTTITNITTAATGDQPDPNTIGDDLDETVNVQEQANLITVKALASGNNTPAEGEIVTFDITVTNDGPNTATNVSLTDLLPPGLTATGANGSITQGTYNPVTGLFDIGTLANGASATLTLEGTVDVGAGGTTITNVTTAATGDQLDPTTVGDDLTESVGSINDADLVTVKSLASGDTTPDEGDTVIFEIRVTNNGGAQATNISLTDSLPPGLTFTGSSTTQGSYDIATGLFDIGTLNVGQSATLTLEGTVDVGEGGNTITNITTAATGDQPDPSTVGDDLEESVTVNDAANLVTVKTLASGNPTPTEGDTVTFQIEVTNFGGAQATNVSLTDSLPAGITYTADTTSQGSYNPATGVFTIGTLNVGDTAIITLSGTVDAGQGGNTITNITTAATGDQMDPTTFGDDLEEAVIVDNTTNLVTVKTLASGNATPDEGDTVTFDITVTNNGPIGATNVSLTDLLPPGLTATALNGGITQGTYDATTGIYTIGNLAVGQSATLTLEGTVDVGQAGNTITNVTTAATGDQNDLDTVGDDLEESVIVGIPAADLVTVKTLASGNATPDEGDTVIFQITVTNDGPDTATGVSLTDSLPAGLTFVADTTSQGTYDQTTGLFDIGTLASGATATLTLEGTVDVGQGGNTITNITTAATGDQPDPSTVGDDLEESVTVNDAANLVTVKTLASGNPTPAEGDTVTFQIEITNFGGAQATNVSLTDSLPVGISFTGSTVSQGSYDETTGVFDIGTLNVGDVATLTLTGTVDVGQGGNTITNITTAATGDQVDPSTVGDDLDASVDVIDNTTDLVTVKTLASGDTTPNEGDIVSFQIAVTNNGGAQATNVSLTDSLPAGISFTGSTVSQGSYDDTTGLFDIGTLNVGQTATLTLTGTVDAGQAGMRITNITTAATGDQVDPSIFGDDLAESVDVNPLLTPDIGIAKLAGDATPNGDFWDVTFTLFVENTGTTTLNNLTVFDDIAAQFGNAFEATSGTTVQNFTGTGTAPTGNANFSVNTAQNLINGGVLDVGDSFEIVFTVTIDPEEIPNTSQGLNNQAVAGGFGVNPDGTPLTDPMGDPVTTFDDSDNGVDPNSENAEDNGDGVFGNDPTPVIIADLAIAKSIVGQPVLNEFGFFVVTFQVAVENTGTVDLGSLSLQEDLSNQFGPAFVNAGNLQIVTGTSDPGSNITVDPATWNGDTATELLDTTNQNTLVVGDSFILQFDVQIDQRQVNSPLANQVTGDANAVDGNGNQILNSNSNPITANDLSDSGFDTRGTNPNVPDDQGTPDDPTLFDPPAVPLGEIAGTVFQDDNNDGFQQPGENGIAGVQITLTGTDVYGDPVNTTVLTDANGRYLFQGLNAGTYTVTQSQPIGFVDGIDIGDPAFTAANDQFSNIQLGFGQTIDATTFAEQLSGDSSLTAGNPPNLPFLGPLVNNPISNLINGFIGAQSTIYSGIPINANADPLSLDSGRAVTGGYTGSGDGWGENCDPCGEVIDPCGEAVDACGNAINAPIMNVPVITGEDCGCEGVPVETGTVVPSTILEGEENLPAQDDQDSESTADETEISELDESAPNDIVVKIPFLKRFSNWLNV